MTLRVVIPARYGATRLPGKPLALAAGRPLIEHVYARACASGADSVVVATDDERIRAVACAFGAQVILTRPDHASGTDRVAEVVTVLGYADSDVVVNLQGDEPRMPGAVIGAVGAALAGDPGATIATAAQPLAAADLANPAVVKVLCDAAGYALYFSRAPVPYARDGLARGPLAPEYRHHLGIYAYRAGWLKGYAELAPCGLEAIEKLEQLRALYHGARFRVVDVAPIGGGGIDTPEDLRRWRAEVGGGS